MDRKNAGEYLAGDLLPIHLEGEVRPLESLVALADEVEIAGRGTVREVNDCVVRGERHEERANEVDPLFATDAFRVGELAVRVVADGLGDVLDELRCGVSALGDPSGSVPRQILKCAERAVEVTEALVVGEGLRRGRNVELGIVILTGPEISPNPVDDDLNILRSRVHESSEHAAHGRLLVGRHREVELAVELTDETWKLSERTADELREIGDVPRRLNDCPSRVEHVVHERDLLLRRRATLHHVAEVSNEPRERILNADAPVPSIRVGDGEGNVGDGHRRAVLAVENLRKGSLHPSSRGTRRVLGDHGHQVVHEGLAAIHRLIVPEEAVDRGLTGVSDGITRLVLFVEEADELDCEEPVVETEVRIADNLLGSVAHDAGHDDLEEVLCPASTCREHLLQRIEEVVRDVVEVTCEVDDRRVTVVAYRVDGTVRVEAGPTEITLLHVDAFGERTEVTGLEKHGDTTCVSRVARRVREVRCGERVDEVELRAADRLIEDVLPRHARFPRRGGGKDVLRKSVVRLLRDGLLPDCVSADGGASGIAGVVCPSVCDVGNIGTVDDVRRLAALRAGNLRSDVSLMERGGVAVVVDLCLEEHPLDEEQHVRVDNLASLLVRDCPLVREFHDALRLRGERRCFARYHRGEVTEGLGRHAVVGRQGVVVDLDAGRVTICIGALRVRRHGVESVLRLIAGLERLPVEGDRGNGADESAERLDVPGRGAVGGKERTADVEVLLSVRSRAGHVATLEGGVVEATIVEEEVVEPNPVVERLPRGWTAGVTCEAVVEEVVASIAVECPVPPPLNGEADGNHAAGVVGGISGGCEPFDISRGGRSLHLLGEVLRRERIELVLDHVEAIAEAWLLNIHAAGGVAPRHPECLLEGGRVDTGRTVAVLRVVIHPRRILEVGTVVEPVARRLDAGGDHDSMIAVIGRDDLSGNIRLDLLIHDIADLAVIAESLDLRGELLVGRNRLPEEVGIRHELSELEHRVGRVGVHEARLAEVLGDAAHRLDKEFIDLHVAGEVCRERVPVLHGRGRRVVGDGLRDHRAREVVDGDGPVHETDAECRRLREDPGLAKRTSRRGPIGPAPLPLVRLTLVINPRGLDRLELLPLRVAVQRGVGGEDPHERSGIVLHLDGEILERRELGGDGIRDLPVLPIPHEEDVLTETDLSRRILDEEATTGAERTGLVRLHVVHAERGVLAELTGHAAGGVELAEVLIVLRPLRKSVERVRIEDLRFLGAFKGVRLEAEGEANALAHLRLPPLHARHVGVFLVILNAETIVVRLTLVELNVVLVLELVDVDLDRLRGTVVRHGRDRVGCGTVHEPAAHHR